MTRIRIGNQTSKTAFPITLPFEYAMEKGFDAFEWFPDKDPSGTGWKEKDLTPEIRERIRGLGLKHDILFSVHAPLDDDPLQFSGISAYEAGLELLRDIKASLFIIHFPEEGGLRDFQKAIMPLIRYLDETNGVLSIENTPSTSPENINLFFTLLQEENIPYRHVGLCLDLGHANLHHETRNDYLRYLAGIHDSIPVNHVHAHENYGDSDSHLTLFSGPAARDEKGILAFIHWLKKHRFEGAVILEQWPQPPELLDRAREKLREIWDKVSGRQSDQ